MASFAGVLVPQVSDKSPSYFETWKLTSPKTFYIINLLQLNRVYTSVWFLALVFIILLSLGYSIYLQIKRNIRVHGSRDNPPIPPLLKGGEGGFLVEQITINSELTSGSLIKFMKNKGYRLNLNVSPLDTLSLRGARFLACHCEADEVSRSNLKTGEEHAPQSKNEIATPFGLAMTNKEGHNEQSTMNGEQILAFSKNSINRWGGVVFHSGIFLIIVAALVTFSFQKRGFVQVMEGEVFSGNDSDFLVKNMGLFVRKFDTGFKIHLSGFRHAYWDSGDIKSLESSVVVIKGDKATDHNISVNSPLNINGVKVYQSSDYGYALTFLLKRSTGEEIMTHFLLDKPDKIGRQAIGRSDFPNTDYIFKMKFYPDITRPSFYPSKPILYLTVFEKGTAIFEGLLIPWQAIKIKDDILQFAAIRNWSGLIFAKNIGSDIAYAGFIIAVTGIIIIYMLPYKEIVLTRVGDSITSIHGTTKRYHAIFEEEMNNIKAELGVKADG